ncbi:MAG TPA: DUF6786 family protein, partial [Flavitalea sp.]|nr:DUF6786 family protein [Flavitalea sp.]
YDKQFLQQYDSNIVELKNGNAAVLVSPAYQGKIFTSSAEGDDGKSFGWINYKAFTAAIDPHMNAYGGENRLWLGPEGGKYSLYFKQGDSMVFNKWKTPAPIDTEHWEVDHKDAAAVTLKKDISISNYTGTLLNMHVTRIIEIQDRSEIKKTLGITLEDSTKVVGYTTNNILKNTGDHEWNEQTGMPCIWILDMFNPSDATVIVIPHKPAQAGERVATTNYFGEIPAERIFDTGKALFFKADGKSRGKLGIVPAYALPFAGSYDAQNNVLTITSFSVDNNAKYINQEWNTIKPVFSGDAMNAYNDGPLEDGTQMGPFYEIESVSPAAALKPSEEIKHTHSVYHFTGNKQQLNNIAEKVLGVSLQTVETTFK